MKKINESSLSRVWQHAQSNRPIGLLTAFRGENTEEQNKRLNTKLAAELRSLGYGFFYVDGAWIENEGTPEEVYVSEDSIFVVGNEGSDEQFLKAIIELGREYKQDGVLVKTKDGAKVYDKAGNVSFDVGVLKPGKFGQIYTRLRNNKNANTFVFEAERDDTGFITRLTQLAGLRK